MTKGMIMKKISSLFLIIWTVLFIQGCESSSQTIQLDLSEYNALIEIKEDHKAQNEILNLLKQEKTSLSDENDVLKNTIHALETRENKYLEVLDHYAIKPMFIFQQNGKYGLKDMDGNIEIEALYDDIRKNYHTDKGFIVRLNADYGHIDKFNHLKWEVAEPFEPFQLFPKHDEDNDPKFLLFLEEFKEKIHNKDVDYMMKHFNLTEGAIGYAKPEGLEGFKDYLKYDSNPEESKFWTNIESAIHLGFVKDGSYTAPSTRIQWPQNYDSFDFLVCTHESVNVYDIPSENGRIITSLDHSMVRNTFHTVDEWYNIALSDGRRGFIHKDNLGSAFAFTVTFKKIDDLWTFSIFLGGD